VPCVPNSYEIKKDVDESEDTIKTLTHATEKKQPNSKKHRGLEKANFCSSVVGNDRSQFPEDFHRR
jgi:hypothetical protein